MTEPAFPYGVEVTLIRREVLGVDQYGNDVRGPVATVVPGAVTWPRTSAEETDARNTVIVGMTVLLPPGVDVKPTDTFLIDGVAYEVTGQPFDWSHNPWTQSRAGVQVELERVSG